MMMVILGDINIDITVPLSEYPVLGQDCLAAALSFHCGGVGANTAFALARLGAPVRLVGCIGNDWFGSFVRSQLASEGIDLSLVQKAERAPTGFMFIAVSPDGQRTIFGSRGANAEVPDAAKARQCLHGANAFHVMGYSFMSTLTEQLARQLIRTAKDTGLHTSMDVGVFPSRTIPEKLLQLANEVDVIFGNAEEVTLLTREQDAGKAFAAMEKSGAREMVLKLGSRGCLIRTSEGLTQVPPFSVRPVDTTGAGDAFTAAFLRARLEGWSNAECAVFANAAGAAASELLGGGEHMPQLSRIIARMSETHFASAWDEVRLEVIRRLETAAPRTSKQVVQGV